MQQLHAAKITSIKDRIVDIRAHISNALSLRARLLPVRATFGSTPPGIFANNKQLEKLHSDNWQVVFGRRGAGKTTVLANYGKRITRELTQGVVSIELLATGFISKFDSTSKISDEEIAQIYFANFMVKIADHLFNVFSNQNHESKFYRLFVELGRRKRVEDLVTSIHNSVVRTKATPIGGDHEESEEETDENKGTLGAAFSANAKVSLRPTKQQGGITAEGGFHRNDDVTKVVKVTRALKKKYFRYDYFDTRNLLKQLLEELRVGKMIIIIDEWSELDRSARTRVQPHFAELIKKVFWNQPEFVFKIGAVRNQTRFSDTSENGGVFGLEISGDIFDIDLDYIYSAGEIDMYKFFEELIFRHLRFCDPALNAFVAKTDKIATENGSVRPLDTFIEFIFKSKADFQTLIDGADGLPRDFIEIFDDIAQRTDYSVKNPWSRKDVAEAIIRHSVNRKQKNLARDDYSLALYRKMVDMVNENNSRLLLIPREVSPKLANAVGDFYHKRLIHDVRSDTIPASLRPVYDFFNIDLGIVFDTTKSNHAAKVKENNKCHLTGAETPNDLVRFVIRDFDRATN